MSVTLSAGLAGMTPSAAAAVLVPEVAAVPVSADSCAGSGQNSGGRIAALSLMPQPSKASAILGGQMSALERVMQGQSSPAPLQVAVSPTGVGLIGKVLMPGIGGSGCDRFALPRTILPGVVTSSPGNDEFLLSRRLPVNRTAFDTEWNRVSRSGLSLRSVRKFMPSSLRRDAVDLAMLQEVNLWANRQIHYAEDIKHFGRADYWADAATTLRTKVGDCEDIAIAKMQILAEMGVARSDLYLTIARDLVRHSDHALLVVKMDGRYWVLDNATDRLLDANEQLDYQPVLSFSADHKWLHGSVSLAMN